MKISKSSCASILPDVLSRGVGDETVILSLQDGTYFGLDAVGSRVWQLIEERTAVSDLIETLLDEYDVERGELERDVDELLTNLRDAGLVRIEG